MIKLTACIAIACGLSIGLVFAPGQISGAEEIQTYIGSLACKTCHPNEYFRFNRFSKKPHSYTQIKLMKKGLTDDEYKGCLECHVTGYGRPGGFVSESQTPHLMELGCEACHGPGGVHASSQAAKDIKGRGRLSLADCEKCHREDRIEAFNFRPLIYGGAH
ncbi:MAG: cytochrome c family protein [Deltaproteobacteria bacterium]|nr:cytochrome c family protein [Deltaproteobacteria bacterium]